LQVMSQRIHKKPLPDGIANLLLMAWHRPVKVGRNGVAIRIAGAMIRYGAFTPELQALAIGTQVRVTYDPDDLDSVVVWTMDHRLICRAEQNRRHNRSISSEHLRDTMRRRNRDKRALRNARKVNVAGLVHDPIQQAVASLAADAARRRKPDPPPPDGGALLIPLQTPVKAPPKRLRKAVGAGVVDEIGDLDAHLHDFLSSDTEVAAGKSIPTASEALRRWNKENSDG